MHVSALCCDTVASPVRTDMSNSVLKTNRGKFIRIDSKLRLCAEDIQNEAENGTAAYWHPLKITPGRTGAHCDSLDQIQLCKTLQPRWAWIKIAAKQKCCLVSLIAPQVHIETKDQKRKAYKFPYNGKNYWVKADASKLEVNVRLLPVDQWDIVMLHVWIFFFLLKLD